ncbi:hypothetical protein [Actinoplanes sp. NPDC051411]|uniref:hypothetical protein n=1 Tax=Actinoplanes sp. NPDC051411 TaxID=3155522 RepID=UPI0034361733
MHRLCSSSGEQHALDQPDPPIGSSGYPARRLAAVDKAVAFQADIGRARRAGGASTSPPA